MDEQRLKAAVQRLWEDADAYAMIYGMERLDDANPECPEDPIEAIEKVASFLRDIM